MIERYLYVYILDPMCNVTSGVLLPLPRRLVTAVHCVSVLAWLAS